MLDDLKEKFEKVKKEEHYKKMKEEIPNGTYVYIDKIGHNEKYICMECGGEMSFNVYGVMQCEDCESIGVNS